MLEQRNLKHDLLAVALLALTVFLALALLSYDSADPPSTVVYPAHDQVQNTCGRVGAWTSHLLFEGLGLGAYYLVLSLATLSAMLLSRRELNQWAVRTAGWVMSLVGLTTLFSMLAPSFTPGPVIGSGGYLGAGGRGLLEINLASTGAYLVVLSLLAGGLLLCTDYVLLRLTAWAVMTPLWGVRRSMAGRRSQRRSDIDDVEQELSVRIRGKNVAGPAVEEDEVEEDEETEVAESDEDVEEEDEAEEAELPVKRVTPPTLPVRMKAPAKKDERQEMMRELDAAAIKSDEPSDYELPPIDMLLPTETFQTEEQEKEVRRKAKVLEKTFANFGFNVRVVEIETGPVIAQYEVELEAGLRLSKITSLAEDLAIALRVPSVRIVAPIPGKNTVGIEVPNEERQLVRMREVIEESAAKVAKMRIPLFLGKDVAGNPLVVDLTTLPHLLIAGRTGTGKSVCLNSMILSMLMTRRPDEVRMLLIDPKMVELSSYKSLPHLMHPVVTDMRKAEAILAWAVEKMEERYALLARAGVRHISGYNQLGEEELMERLQPETDEERANIPTHLPYIVIVADEMADLMMTAAKEVETHIIRLAQKSRAVGIHLVLATQKPTVDVITGLIKSNLPARIAFQVASRTDSRVVLDEMGADKLLGNGDMLFLWPGTSTLLRGQGTYLTDEEINKVVDFVGTTEPQFVKELVQLKPAASKDGGDGDADRFKNRDELYEAAIDVVVREGRGSVSLLQRALGIGYGRGARLIDYMAEDGIVGTYNGSQAREVLVTVEQWEEMSGAKGASSGGASATATAPAKPKKSNKIRPEPVEEDEYEEVDEVEDAPFDTDDAEAVEADVIEDDAEFEEVDESDTDEDEDESDDEEAYEEDEVDDSDEEEDEAEPDEAPEPKRRKRA